MNTSKKHIIVAGVPRAGKTTICEKLAHTLKYQHLIMDAVTVAFEETFPETGILHTDCWEFRETSKNLIKLLKSFIKLNDYEKFDYRLAFDLFHITPKDYYENIDPNCCEIYFFGYPNANIETRLRKMKECDTEYDWTNGKDDEFLRDRIKTYIEISKWLQEECEKYNLPFIDISDHREEIINEFVKKII